LCSTTDGKIDKRKYYLTCHALKGKIY